MGAGAKGLAARAAGEAARRARNKMIRERESGGMVRGCWLFVLRCFVFQYSWGNI
jgi:hypothetical protein